MTWNVDRLADNEMVAIEDLKCIGAMLKLFAAVTYGKTDGKLASVRSEFNNKQGERIANEILEFNLLMLGTKLLVELAQRVLLLSKISDSFNHVVPDFCVLSLQEFGLKDECLGVALVSFIVKITKNENEREVRDEDS